MTTCLVYQQSPLFAIPTHQQCDSAAPVLRAFCQHCKDNHVSSDKPNTGGFFFLTDSNTGKSLSLALCNTCVTELV